MQAQPKKTHPARPDGALAAPDRFRPSWPDCFFLAEEWFYGHARFTLLSMSHFTARSAKAFWDATISANSGLPRTSFPGLRVDLDLPLQMASGVL
jgi:hypothetical protein